MSLTLNADQNRAHLEEALDYLSNAQMGSASGPWKTSLEQLHDVALRVAATGKLSSLKVELDLPPSFRERMEALLQKLHELRKLNREEIDRKVRDIERVEKIILHLESHRQNYLAQVHLRGDGDMMMSLDQRERHEARMSEWEDEIQFRKSMMAILREKARLEFPELHKLENELRQLLSAEEKFRVQGPHLIDEYAFSIPECQALIETVLNENMITWLSLEEWDNLNSRFPMSSLRELQLHFECYRSMGYRLSSDWKYFSKIEGEWIVGDIDSDGISFDHPRLQRSLEEGLRFKREKQRFAVMEFLRTASELIFEKDDLMAAEAQIWLNCAYSLGLLEIEAQAVLCTLTKTYQLKARRDHIVRLLEVAEADGVVKKEEKEYLKYVEHHLDMPEVSVNRISKTLLQNENLKLLPPRDEMLLQVCRMALCDDELHENEKRWIEKTFEELGLDMENFKENLQARRQVS